MVCVNRTTNVLPVSKLYDQFVKPGSGIVEREFGPFDAASFRVDVSGPIDTGNSWQLGLYLVHALQAAPEHRLIEDIAAADQIIWATGCVDYHLNVTEVDHVAAKIEASGDLFAEWAALGKPVAVITAAGVNESDARAALADSGAAVFGAENAGQAGAILGLASAPKSALVISDTVASSASVRNIALAVLILVLAGGAVFAALQQDKLGDWSEALKELVSNPASSGIVQEEPAPLPPAETTPIIAKPAPTVPVAKPAPPAPINATKIVALPEKPILPTINVGISRLTPPEGSTYLNVQFGGTNPVVKPISQWDIVNHEDSHRETTCGLRFDIDPGKTPRYLAIYMSVDSGRFVQTSRIPVSLSGGQKVPGVQTWAIALPRKSDQPFSYRFVVIAASRPLEEILKRFRSISDFEDAAQELTDKSIDMVIHRHRVLASQR
ncbi:MAG: hypothetical protein HOH61_13245 [Rhodospirillaceae bacterium]|nr:hypothetical protein [Rhodospirillaceae bacterium]